MTLKSLFALLLSSITVLSLSCGSDDDEGGPGDGCTIDGEKCNFACREGLGCVQCAGDGDCGAGEPFCVLGRCRACAFNEDCGTGQACYPRDHSCHPICTAGSCGPEESICDPDSGKCVGCLKSEDCAGTNRPVCDADRGQCAECRDSADCGAAQPVCDRSDGECHECLVDIDCKEGYRCNHDHECRSACAGDDECKDPNRPYCNLDTATCSECVGNADCPETRPFCRDKRECVSCLVNTDCTNPALPFCRDFGCAQCIEPADCVTQPNCTNGGCKCKGGTCSP